MSHNGPQRVKLLVSVTSGYLVVTTEQFSDNSYQTRCLQCITKSLHLYCSVQLSAGPPRPHLPPAVPVRHGAVLLCRVGLHAQDS